MFARPALLGAALCVGCAASESSSSSAQNGLDAAGVSSDTTVTDAAATDGSTSLDSAGDRDVAGVDGAAEADASDGDAGGTPATLALVNAIPAGDPRAAGEHLFLHETWGVEILHELPPAAFLLALEKDEPEVFGNQFEGFGFISDPADDLPVGLKRGTKDPEQVHFTCAVCHVGRLNDGRLWAGLPNRALDPERFLFEVNERWTTAGNPPLVTDTHKSKLHDYGNGRTAADSSEHPTSAPADFPVYFNLGERTALNHMGTGKDLRTEAAFGLFAFGAGAPNAETAKVPFPSDETLGTFLAYLGAIEPPPPPPTDPAQVAAGLALFKTEKCDSCHHLTAEGRPDLGKDGVVTVDCTGVLPELLPGDDPKFPRGRIATSPVHFRLLQGSGDCAEPLGPNETPSDEAYVDFVLFIAAKGLNVSGTDGYRVPSLRALTETAPYLHNGSVPTLEALLAVPSARPKTFEVAGVIRDVDASPGNTNIGHAFGTTLSSEQKVALIEFLHSL